MGERRSGEKEDRAVLKGRAAKKRAAGSPAALFESRKRERI
jgi:hypothetical protein